MKRLPMWLRLVAVIIGIYLIAPLLVIFPIGFTGSASFAFPPKSWSLDYYVKFFTAPEWRDALLDSLLVGSVTAVLATVLGSLAAIGLAKSEFPGMEVVRTFLLMPIMVPAIVGAIAVYSVALRMNLVGSFWVLVATHCMLAIPFVIIAVGASMSGLDARLENAAAISGANKVTAFFLVTLPLIRPGVLSGAVFAFATSFDEVVMALYLQTPELRTLPVQMYTSVKLQTDPTIAAASTVIVVVISTIVLLPMLRKAPKNG